MDINPKIKENPYALLAFFLSPWKKSNDIEALHRLITKESVHWEQLLLQANNNLTTPLWYVSFKNNDLLDLLPEELRNYLQLLYEANLERNIYFIDELIKINRKFIDNNISFTLLKGGAALWDNLYNDPGARLLQDLDILVKPDEAKFAWQILVKSGYEEISNPGREFEGLFTDSRHHHLNALRKPGSPAIIEIHYKTAYAKAGELLPHEEAWENTVEILYSGVKMKILNPTCRLIHNAAHGLISEAGFIKGMISLQQLAEFVFIAKKYQKDILWQSWLTRSMEKKVDTEFLSYLTLAQDYMGMELPTELTLSRSSKFHAARIYSASMCLQNYNFSKSLWSKVSIKLKQFMLRSYYLLKLPAWVWQNVCYTEEGGNTFMRIKYLFKKAFSSRSRANI